MHEQLTLADAYAEAEARDIGMELAAAHGQPLLELARILAARHAKNNGTVTIENVRRELGWRVPGWEPGNWMGSVFKEKRWEPTGRWVQTEHKGGHRRAVREWRLA
jgi:hypothetical protein